jgi:hypothetical protein
MQSLITFYAQQTVALVVVQLGRASRCFGLLGRYGGRTRSGAPCPGRRKPSQDKKINPFVHGGNAWR